MKLEWKHRQSEKEVFPVVHSAFLCDKSIVTSFPRSINTILCCSFPISFESRKSLRTSMIMDILQDVYHVYDSGVMDEGDIELAGYTFARGGYAIIFSDPQFGEGFERFTISHEAGHLITEYFPLIANSCASRIFEVRDPKEHFFGNTEQIKEKREVIANLCAAELLAPYKEVGRLFSELPSHLDPVDAVKDHFGLSRRAARIRLLDLGLISESSGLLFSQD
jgi:Zn-dependent peptidase ImmA (M78 family)